MNRHAITVWALRILAAGMAHTPFVVSAQSTAGEFLNEPYNVGDELASDQWPHHICYNPDRNEYLVVFNDRRADPRWIISYYILDGEGRKQTSRPLGSITDDPLVGSHYGAATYDPGSQEYLIAYSGWLGTPRVDEHDQLRSHRVNADGNLVGSSNLIHDGQGGIGNPLRGIQMAYSPTSDVHLVAWKDDKATGCEVYATLLGGTTGVRVSALFNLSQGDPRYSDWPVVAWNSARDEFLVVYQVSCEDVNQGWNLYGRRIHAGNQIMSGRFQITDRPGWECDGNLAYDADLDRYLLAYEDTSAGQWVWGQFLTPDGEPSGPRFDLLAPPYIGRGAWLTWHPITRDFLLGCIHQESFANIGRRISQVGVPLGDPFVVTGAISILPGNFDPFPIANTLTNDYLYAWCSGYKDVYSRRYKTLPRSDVTPPVPVTQFTATAGHGQNTLSWTNSTSADSLGTIIRCKTTGYPTDAHDGLPVTIRPKSPGASDTFVHAGLVRANTYYYAAFAYDAIPNHASAAQVSARPLAPADFDSDDDVDQQDFGHLQRCFGGSGQPIAAGCEDADLDDEGDVDADDMDVFIGCMSGADRPPEC